MVRKRLRKEKTFKNGVDRLNTLIEIGLPTLTKWLFSLTHKCNSAIMFYQRFCDHKLDHHQLLIGVTPTSGKAFGFRPDNKTLILGRS